MNYYTQAQINALLVGVSAGNGTNVTWGTTSSSTSNPQPLRIYWVYTNGLPWYGRTLTNGQN
jgi:hypothetical protein